MLHEVLLALSGHPSPLLSSEKKDLRMESILSPSERGLLRLVAHLGSLQREIRSSATTISSSHPSIVCRAVAASIVGTHLAEFQQKILSVEKGIVKDDPRYVGAYDIVPLAGIVGAFEGWARIMEWLTTIMNFMQNPNDGFRRRGPQFRSGAEIINLLQKESRTGYPSIERIALNLVRVAEATWLRQVSTWLLYGRLPTLGATDFFIQHGSSTDPQAQTTYEITKGLEPAFVSSPTASSILFIGKSLNHIQERGMKTLDLSSRTSGESLLSSHLTHISALGHPITSTSLSRVVGAIRSSLSQNALQKLLPIADILQTLNVLRAFFLLERGEFAVALIGAADDCLAGRHVRMAAESRQKDVHRLGGVMIKEGEVASVLNGTWTALATLQDLDDDEADEELDMARDFVHLSLKRQGARATSTSLGGSTTSLEALTDLDPLFEDVLLATPTSLTIEVPAPLDLFLTSVETNAYSLIHAYLISVRRSHMHLTELWKLTVLRRTHPAPLRPMTTPTHAIISSARLRSNHRSGIMRSNWAVVSSATFFLAELGEYLQGEVVAESWATFRRWVHPTSDSAAKTTRPTSPLSSCPSDSENEGSRTLGLQKETPRDPEVLTFAHRTYLTALIHALLLDDTRFTKSLRNLLTRCDHVVALLRRLNTITQSLESEGTAGTGEASKHLVSEEAELLRSLKEVRGSLKSGLDDLMERLREMDGERVAGGGIADPGAFVEDAAVVGRQLAQETVFVPWKGAGVNRLLMKLDFGGMGS